ncbi:hypothetical protein JHK87_016460 [Glycine soja]|nr:hypothetical protein JHK87_016460 [Glycine soja]
MFGLGIGFVAIGSNRRQRYFGVLNDVVIVNGVTVKRLCPSQNPRAENMGEVERRLFLSLSDVASLSLDLNTKMLYIDEVLVEEDAEHKSMVAFFLHEKIQISIDYYGELL